MDGCGHTPQHIKGEASTWRAPLVPHDPAPSKNQANRLVWSFDLAILSPPPLILPPHPLMQTPSWVLSAGTHPVKPLTPRHHSRSKLSCGPFTLRRMEAWDISVITFISRPSASLCGQG